MTMPSRRPRPGPPERQRHAGRSRPCRAARPAASAGPRPPLSRVHGDVSTAPHIHGAYDSGGCDSAGGDGDSSPRSPFTPTRPTTLSVISELDTIQSEVWSPSEEPASPHSPSPISVTNLLDDSAPRAPRKLDHYYAAPTRSTSCCVVA